MSWMFTRPDGFDAIVNIRVTMLDDPRPFPPFLETYTSEKLAWASTPAVRSFDKFPAFGNMSAWPETMQRTLARRRSLHKIQKSKLIASRFVGSMQLLCIVRRFRRKCFD